MFNTLPNLKRGLTPHNRRAGTVLNPRFEKIPETGEKARFKVPGKGDYALGQEPPLAPGRLVYNTDDASTLERFRIRELCEGWPTHRDACEWSDLRNIFAPDAYINISWQQNFRDQAINEWARSFAKGDFITHRCQGHAVETKGNRAINKMKVTVSTRFSDRDGAEWDSEWFVENFSSSHRLLSFIDRSTANSQSKFSDCRFIFFLQKQQDGWKIVCNHPIYEKDKLIPADPARPPKIDYEALAMEPHGYRFLAYGMREQGHPIKRDLPQLFGTERDALYMEMIDWLDGKDIDFPGDGF